MSRQRFYISKGWCSRNNGIRWFACDADCKKNDILIRYSFSDASDALMFCDFLNSQFDNIEGNNW
jgi:hypothetical protein